MTTNASDVTVCEEQSVDDGDVNVLIKLFNSANQKLSLERSKQTCMHCMHYEIK